jgi:tRNA threonylcarbamoyl adenosine modification protein (Sua5/YciO/YrdC/YwlC family)
VAVDGLLKAKGRGRDMPPPVLVGTVRAAMALVMDLGEVGKDLIDEFWPGGLTIVCRSSPTLVWDLGETKGTVAIRMPLHPVALDLLKRTGPLAVSSANVSGRPPATTADEAMAQLGDSVAVYLDGGPCADEVPSTIVDLTGSMPRLLRRGVIPVERLREVVPLALEDETPDDESPEDVVPEDVVPEDVVPEDVVAEDVGPEDVVPGGGVAGNVVPGGEVAGDEAPQDEALQDPGEPAPEGPAHSVPDGAGRPREVFHGLEEPADQGNRSEPDVTG